MKINTRVLLLIAFVASGLNATAQEVRIPQSFTKGAELKKTIVNENRLRSIDSLLQSFVGDKKVSCVTAFAAKGGNVLYKKSFGWKDVENQVPATRSE